MALKNTYSEVPVDRVLQVIQGTLATHKPNSSCLHMARMVGPPLSPFHLNLSNFSVKYMTIQEVKLKFPEETKNKTDEELQFYCKYADLLSDMFLKQMKKELSKNLIDKHEAKA